MPLYVNAMVCMAIVLASFNVLDGSQDIFGLKAAKKIHSVTRVIISIKKEKRKKNGHINNSFFALRQDQQCLLHSSHL